MKLQDLGLVKKTPNPKKRKYQRKGPPIKDKESPTAQRKLMGSEKAVVGKNMDCSVNEECPYDHSCFSTSYNEEKDKRYLDKKFDSFGVKCQG